MSEAIAAYRHVAASDEFILKEKMRSKARHDEAQAIGNAERRGRATGMEEMIILAFQGNATPEVIETMRKGAGITNARLAELMKLAK